MDRPHEAELRALACARLDAAEVEPVLLNLKELVKTHVVAQPLGVTNAYSRCVKAANLRYLEDRAEGLEPQEARANYLANVAACDALRDDL